MRILFLSQLLPLPLDAGPKVRSYYTLRYLVEAGHEVTLASFRRPSDTDEAVHELSAFCTSVETVRLDRTLARDAFIGFRSLLTRRPFLIERDCFSAMHALLARLCRSRQFDAVHADQLWMAPYASRCEIQGPRILDQHNAVFLAARRMGENGGNPLTRTLFRNEATKLERYERSACAAFDKVVWVSDVDRSALRDRSRDDQVIPIATDPQKYARASRERKFRILFLGGMHWPPNAEGVRWFAETVWPRIAQRDSSAVFTVVGKRPPAELRNLGPGDRVEATGYVEDIQPYLDETAVFVVPLLSGAGMRVKILDAWCGALPVVSTTLGAEGIETRNGEDILLGDSPEEFADAVLRVLSDQRLAGRIGEGGRSTVERLYDWRKVYRAWGNIYH